MGPADRELSADDHVDQVAAADQERDQRPDLDRPGSLAGCQRFQGGADGGDQVGAVVEDEQRAVLRAGRGEPLGGGADRLVIGGLHAQLDDVDAAPQRGVEPRPRSARGHEVEAGFGQARADVHAPQDGSYDGLELREPRRGLRGLGNRLSASCWDSGPRG